MGLIHSRAAKQRNRAEARLLDGQAKREAAAAVADKWEPIVTAIEAGEASWDDLPRLQKMSMPIGYQLRCRAAARRYSADGRA